MIHELPLLNIKINRHQVSSQVLMSQPSQAEALSLKGLVHFAKEETQQAEQRYT